MKKNLILIVIIFIITLLKANVSEAPSELGMITIYIIFTVAFLVMMLLQYFSVTVFFKLLNYKKEKQYILSIILFYSLASSIISIFVMNTLIKVIILVIFTIVYTYIKNKRIFSPELILVSLNTVLLIIGGL